MRHHSRFLRRTSVVPLLALVLVACASTGAPSPDPSATPKSERPTRSAGPVETAPPSESAAIGEVPAAILEAILADAADRTGVSVGDLSVARAEAVTWSDGSLDCPEPGMLYTQALVDGYHVVLLSDGVELDYRVGSRGAFRLCEGGGTPTGN
jgi:hypothetical protein